MLFWSGSSKRGWDSKASWGLRPKDLMGFMAGKNIICLMGRERSPLVFSEKMRDFTNNSLKKSVFVI